MSKQGIPPVASGAENSRINFALGILSYAGWPVTEGNLRALVCWMQKENTGAGYNPLATTQPMPGAGFWNYIGEGKNYGVRNYTSFEQGVQATVQTLLNGNYPNIVAGLQAGLSGPEGLDLGDLAVWGTGDRANAGQYTVADKGYFPNHPDYQVGTTQGNFDGSATGIATTLPSGGQGYVVDGVQYVAYEILPGSGAWIYFKHAGSIAGSSQMTTSQWEGTTTNWVNGGATTEGLFVDPIASGNRSWDDIMETFLMEAGIYGTDALEDAEVLGVVAEFIARPDMTPEEVQARLEETEWWNSRTTGQLEWNDLSDAEKDLRLKEEALKLVTLWKTYTGETISWADYGDENGNVSWQSVMDNNPELAQWAENVASGSHTQIEAVHQWIYPEAEAIENSPVNRERDEEEIAQNTKDYEISNNRRAVIEEYERWGVEISDQQADQMAEQLYMRERSMADVMATAEAVSAAKWVHKPEGVDFDTWAQPYATQYGALMEKSSPTFRDSAFSNMLMGENLTMHDFKKQIKQTEEWKNTGNAQDEYSKAFGTIGRLMGFG